MPSSPLAQVARFAVLYGVLVALCATLPVYEWIETAVARVAAAGLRERPLETRALEVVRRDQAFVYVYEFRVGAIAKTIERPLHKHAFVLVLYLALALSTPKLGARDLAVGALGGGAVVFGLCVLMLMSDLELWERDALGAVGYPESPGPFPISLGFIEGLHRTAAAGLLPLILWAFFAASRAGRRARTPRATSAS
jgi:hypothetical protein